MLAKTSHLAPGRCCVCSTFRIVAKSGERSKLQLTLIRELADRRRPILLFAPSGILRAKADRRTARRCRGAPAVWKRAARPLRNLLDDHGQETNSRPGGRGRVQGREVFGQAERPDRYDRVWISRVLWAEYSESGVAARGDCKYWKDHEQYSLPLIGPAVRDFGAEPCKGYAFSVRRGQGGLGDLPDLPCRRICPILLIPCKHSWRR